MFLMTAAMLPLHNYALSQHLIMGPLAAPLSPSLWYGLLIIVCGLSAYGFGAARGQAHIGRFGRFRLLVNSVAHFILLTPG